MSFGKRRVINKQHLAIALLIVPVLVFALVLLGAINLLLMLATILLLLIVMVVAKKRGHSILEWFFSHSSERKRDALPDPLTIPRCEVRMVLSGTGDFNARRIMINKDCYNIGRSWDNDFKIESKNISRHHLQIMYKMDENICYAADQGSHNGTYLNGKRMEKGKWYRLLQGDRLMIDDSPFTVDYAHY